MGEANPVTPTDRLGPMREDGRTSPTDRSGPMSACGCREAGKESVSPPDRLGPRDEREPGEAGAEAGGGGDGDIEPEEATGADTSGITAKERKKNTEQRAADRLKESLRLGHIKLH